MGGENDDVNQNRKFAGIRIPKAVIEQARLEDKQLEFKITDDGLLIQPVKKHREGWKEQFDNALKSHESSEADQDWEW